MSVSRYLCQWFLIVGASCFAGCASTDFVASPNANVKTYRVAYLVAHGDKESDIDAAIQRALMRHGFSVSVVSRDISTDTSAFVVKYNDSWNWDLAMYITSLDIEFHDARNGSLVASGSWKNGLLHGYQNVNGVADDIVLGCLDKLNIVDKK